MELEQFERLTSVFFKRVKTIYLKDNTALTLLRYNEKTKLWEPYTKEELQWNVYDFLFNLDTFKELDYQEFSEEVRVFLDECLSNIEIKDKITWAPPASLIHFKNAPYDLKERKLLKEHDSKHCFSKGRSYDLITTKTTLQTLTEAWFEKLFGNATPFMMEFIGYCFLRSYEPFKTIVILISENDQSKRLFFDWLSGILGQENVSVAMPAMLSKATPKELYTLLHEKDLVYYPDITTIEAVDAGALNVLSGGNLITTQTPAGTALNFRNTAKLIFGSNELPTFNPGSLKERVQFVEMHDIPNFEDYPLEELEKEYGIFAFKCIQAFLKAWDYNEMTLTGQMDSLRLQWLGILDREVKNNDRKNKLSKQIKRSNNAKRQRAQQQLKEVFEQLSQDGNGVSVSELAKVCKVSSRAIYKRVKAGKEFKVIDGLVQKII